MGQCQPHEVQQSKVLNLSWGNPKHKSSLDRVYVGSNAEGKDLGVLVDEHLHVLHTSAAQEKSHVLGYIHGSGGSRLRQVILF